MGTVNPRVDVVFKKLFGVEDNKDLLMSLINSVVSQEDQVKDITLLNPYNPQDRMDSRASILDIKAKGHTGKRFNIEIQIANEADYDKRALYYWAKLYSEQLQKGQEYKSLNKAIGIHILNFTSILGTKNYHNVFHVREKDSHIHFFKDLELHTIELTKFTEEVGSELGTLMERVKNKIDLWCAFLTKYDLLNTSALTGPFNDKELKKALDILDEMRFNPKEREEYEAHLKWLRIEASSLKKANEDGREEGRAEGREEGRAEGREEGRAEGRAAIIERMLSQKISPQDIAQLTGIPLKDVLASEKSPL